MKTSYLLVDRILSLLLPHGREREGRIVLPAPESCLGLLERDWLILKQNFPQENKITQTGHTELVFLEGAASTTTISLALVMVREGCVCPIFASPHGLFIPSL